MKSRSPSPGIRSFRPLVYLACPYTPSKDAYSPHQLRVMRFKAATKACAYLMKTHGWNVFSPITHSHPLHELEQMDGDWKFWKKVDTEYLKLTKRLVVLTIEGWRESTGVQAEIKIAKRLKIKVSYLHPHEVGLSNFGLEIPT